MTMTHADFVTRPEFELSESISTHHSRAYIL
jgi:hypothetical protein